MDRRRGKEGRLVMDDLFKDNVNGAEDDRTTIVLTITKQQLKKKMTIDKTSGVSQ